MHCPLAIWAKHEGHGGEMACSCDASAQLMKSWRWGRWEDQYERRSILNMLHHIVSYGKTVKIKASLGYDGLCARLKGKLEARDHMANHWGGEVRLEGLASMDQGNKEEHARIRLMNYEGHVKLWRGPYHFMMIKPSEDDMWWYQVDWWSEDGGASLQTMVKWHGWPNMVMTIVHQDSVVDEEK
jgi:hypothetical protein